MLWKRDNLFPLRREVVHTGIKIGFTFSTFELKPFQVWPAPATVAAFTRIHLPTSTVDPICWRFIRDAFCLLHPITKFIRLGSLHTRYCAISNGAHLSVAVVLPEVSLTITIFETCKLQFASKSVCRKSGGCLKLVLP